MKKIPELDYSPPRSLYWPAGRKFALRSSISLWSCVRFPLASNAPLSPQSLNMDHHRITGLSPRRLWSSNYFRGYYLKDYPGSLLDPHHFGYILNRWHSQLGTKLHPAVSQISRNIWGILFVDFSSQFTIINPDILHQNLSKLPIRVSIRQWFTNFLTERQQQVKLFLQKKHQHRHTSVGCFLSTPILIQMTALHDNTVSELIQDNDESAYKQELTRLIHWCGQNCGHLNPLKTVKMIMGF